MLQANEIQRQFHSVEQAIGQAAQACSAERNLPRELRDCIQRLDRQADLAKDVIASRDEDRLRKLVDELERLGERARRVCGSGAELTAHMKTAVHHLHTELAALRQQLH